MSTSTRSGTAEGFAHDSRGDCAILHIYVPAGSKALALDELPGSMAYMGEAEILLSPGTRIRVTQRIDDLKTTDYTGRAKIVPQYEAYAETP
jgi:hypothetical protein